MPRYVAFLRGVSPMNAKMPELRRCFERAGFGNVRTVRASGNVVFDSPGRAEGPLVRKAEAAMQHGMGRAFTTHVRAVATLQELLERDPFKPFRLPAGAKRVVAFLRTAPPQPPRLPIALRDARVLALHGREAFAYYLPGTGDPGFMTLLEKTFGADITTRTWDTIRLCADT